MPGLLKRRPGPRNLFAPFRCLAILAIVFLASFGGVLRAQTQLATVFGTVTDPSGAVIPGAQITIANQSTGWKRGTVTDSAAEVMINAKLAIGGVAQQTTVSANGAAIDTTTSTNKGLLPQRSLEELPL